ncbi:hypothetical protein SAMN05428949_1235 [Chitinophaga sp. YR627]|uniref:hypothetical protein n=1 Tax=Chitinophaga sp. YR627 TaxID=1881041 RepID=UPI0008E177BB|nr:hypothetical protein [Chitinophaga sp. YR627]SFM90390.1 hypothetical protein SAMN05428949_1235 [Chitinophaga sp. YR627]
MKYYLIIFFFCSLYIFSGCFKQQDFDRVQGSDLLTFTFVPQTVLADGASPATISLKIDSKAIPSKRKLLLKTSLGSFVGGNGDSIIVEADEQFKAGALLVSTRTGQALITATIAGHDVMDTTHITFIKAYPESITISVDSFSINNNYNKEILLSASLKRNNGGVPSQGYSVEFRVVNTTGNVVGFFLNGNPNAITDGNGRTNIRYIATDAASPGKHLAIAFTQQADGSTISDTTYFFVTK